MGVATTALVLRLRTDDNDGRLRRTQLRERMRSERGAKRDGVPVRVRGAAMTVARIGAALTENGCDCDCDHRPADHVDECARCFACRVQAALDAPDESGGR